MVRLFVVRLCRQKTHGSKVHACLLTVARTIQVTYTTKQLRPVVNMTRIKFKAGTRKQFQSFFFLWLENCQTTPAFLIWWKFGWLSHVNEKNGKRKSELMTQTAGRHARMRWRQRQDLKPPLIRNTLEYKRRCSRTCCFGPALSSFLRRPNLSLKKENDVCGKTRFRRRGEDSQD